jgi:hypothetical protein
LNHPIHQWKTDALPTDQGLGLALNFLQRNRQLLEKKLSISLKENFFSWKENLFSWKEIKQSLERRSSPL